MNEEIISRAKAVAETYLQTIVWDRDDYDLDALQAELGKRTFKGQPVLALVVDSPEKVPAALIKGAKTLIDRDGLDPVQAQTALKSSSECIWDLYRMVLYDSAYAVAQVKDPLEFATQPWFEAIRLGLWGIVNLGPLIVGIVRPVAYKDPQNRLHNPSGPAIQWGNWKTYFWRGVSVPGEWIETPGTISPTLGLTHPNIEQRAALCQILGWERVLAQLSARTIDRNPDPAIGELLEVDLPDSGRSRFLKVLCATGRTFVLPVPLEIETAVAANAATYGLQPEEAEIEFRT